MNVLITGTGFIAGNLKKRLVKDGHVVRMISRSNYQGKASWLLQNLRNWEPDIIFHLAATYLADHVYPEHANTLVESNILYTAHLLDAMRMTGVKKLISAGTGFQHYQSLDYDPVNLYAATKQAAEDLIEFYVKAYDFGAVTLKFYDTYGPDDKREKLFNVLKNLNEPLLMSEGNQILDLIHVNDVVEGFIKSQDHIEEGKYKKFFLTSPDKKTLREVVMLYEKIIGIKPPIVWGGQPYRKRQVMNPVVGEILPGWEAKINLEDGIRSLNNNLVADGPRGF